MQARYRKTTDPVSIFLSARYGVMHKDITETNAPMLLANDIRARLLGDVQKFLYAPKDHGVVEIKPGLVYTGGFYYEEGDGSQESVVKNELIEIDNADVLIVDFTKPNAIATISELFYAMEKGKVIKIFINPDLTNEKISSEYWFVLKTLKYMLNYKNVEILKARSDDDIIQYIINDLVTYIE